MCEGVVFKGSRDGLLLVVNETVDFSCIIKQLSAKLEAAIGFFSTGTVVQIAQSEFMTLTTEQQSELVNLFAGYGITLQKQVVEECNRNYNRGAAALPVVAEPEPKKAPTLMVTRTLRSGQELIHDGSIMIVGDVNPGAKVAASGDIVVYGTCRGIMHAGNLGNYDATVTADRLLAAQIRIASFIARSPDHLEEPQGAETARIKDGGIVIGPAYD